MLVPESKSEKERARLARCSAWVATQDDETRRCFCEHGTYVGRDGALARAGFARCDYC